MKRKDSKEDQMAEAKVTEETEKKEATVVTEAIVKKESTVVTELKNKKKKNGQVKANESTKSLPRLIQRKE